MEERFYFCKSCGNLAFMAIVSGVTPYCCGIEMEKLKENTSDGSHEKHVPVIEEKKCHSLKVRVGTSPHPMSKEHGIRFICLETTLGGIIHYLSDNDLPETSFMFEGKPKAVYAYCNIHGLWKVDVT